MDLAQLALQAGGAEGREVTKDDERPWRTESLNADPNGFALALWMEEAVRRCAVLDPRAFLRVSAAPREMLLPSGTA
jgi:hypothetical protein